MIHQRTLVKVQPKS